MNHLPTVIIKSIPHHMQNYPTAGDYSELSGSWFMTISRCDDWRYEALVALHELIEMILTKHNGVKWEDIDEFDKRGDGCGHPDPGTLTNAPYWLEHTIATQFEMELARHLSVDWDKYNEALDALEWRATECLT